MRDDPQDRGGRSRCLFETSSKLCARFSRASTSCSDRGGAHWRGWAGSPSEFSRSSWPSYSKLRRPARSRCAAIQETIARTSVTTPAMPARAAINWTARSPGVSLLRPISAPRTNTSAKRTVDAPHARALFSHERLFGRVVRSHHAPPRSGREATRVPLPPRAGSRDLLAAITLHLTSPSRRRPQHAQAVAEAPPHGTLGFDWNTRCTRLALPPRGMRSTRATAPPASRRGRGGATRGKRRLQGGECHGA